MDVYFTITEVVSSTEKDRKFYRALQSESNPAKRARLYVRKAAMKNGDGMILYLQGGPGFGSPEPAVGLAVAPSSSWAGKALDKFRRIVLMDQRGTGRSSPVTKQTLERLFPALFALDRVSVEDGRDGGGNDDGGDDDGDADGGPDSVLEEGETIANFKLSVQAAAQYLGQMRADNIVRDAEEIKDALLLPLAEDDDNGDGEKEEEEQPRPYGAVLGQSFGGFCVMTYLSQIPNPPRVCLLTGGIAPMLTTPLVDVYDALWDRVKERNLRYYEMYPGDVPLVKRIVRALLRDPPTKLPSGGTLTARRFLSLGMALGGTPSSFASMHQLLSSAFLDNDGADTFSRAFLKRVDSEQPFDDHPIYFLLHESIYANGPKNSPTNWAAHRAYESKVRSTTPSEFDYVQTSAIQGGDGDGDDQPPTLFFGEMVFPWFADGDFTEVSGRGMKSLAEALAKRDDWPPLWDAQAMRDVLGGDDDDGGGGGPICRAAAAVYYDDLYVDFDASMKVTKRGGPMEKCKVWITNEFQHSGLRDDGSNIFSKLHGMATGGIRIPS